MSRPSFTHRSTAAVLLVGVVTACGGRLHPSPSGAPSPSGEAVAATPSTLDRMTVRTAEQQVVVDTPTAAGRRVELMIQASGGYVERSNSSSDGDVRVEGRIPAMRLDGMMDSVAALGKERRRHVTGADVTDQYVDLEARLRSSIALRDRLQQLLGRAATLDEVLTLEKQIARLQSDIDALQARIDQLKSRTELAALAVSLERKHVPGPLAVVGRGVAGLVTKLFVIR